MICQLAEVAGNSPKYVWAYLKHLNESPVTVYFQTFFKLYAHAG